MANQVRSESKNLFPPVQRWLLGRPADRSIFLMVGTLIALLVLVVLGLGKANPANVQYLPEDIVYTRPLSIGHEIRPGTPLVNAAVSSGSLPQMDLSENFFDFGAVRTPEVVERVFIITNRGQAPLIIQNAYTTCGCTLAELTSSEIPPGKAALLTVRFDTGFHDLRGTTVRRGVILQTNDPAHPQPEVWFQATVK